MNIPFIIFILCVFGLVFCGLHFLIKSVGKVYDQIDEIEKIAKSAKTKQELLPAWEQLTSISRRYWNNDFESRLIQVKTYIETKYEYL